MANCQSVRALRVYVCKAGASPDFSVVVLLGGVYLVCSHLSPGHQTEEPLLGVNISLGRRPAGRVDGVAQGAVRDVLPLRQQGDGVLTRPPQQPLRHHPGAAAEDSGPLLRVQEDS